MSTMDRIITWIVGSAVSIIRLLPLPVCFAGGWILGAIAWGILPMYRRLARENMMRAFESEYSNAQIRRMVFKHFMAMGANLLSALKMPALNETEIRNCCRVENKDLLISYLQQGKGVVMAISHIGNWELFAQLNFMLPNVPTGTVYQSLKNKGLNQLIDRDRRSRGVVTFDRKKGIMGAVTMLRQGGLVAVLVDQHAGDSGLWTPFFRRLSSTSPLSALLACKSGAAVVPVAIFTEGFARWRISIRPSIPYDSENPNQLTANLNATLESQIRESPKDWFWLHNRWKLPDPRILLSKEKRGIYLPDRCEQALRPINILVRSTHWLGDAVLSIPAVQALKRGRPDARISVLVSEKLRALWQIVPEVDEVLTISGHPWRVARKLKGRMEEVAVLLPNSLRSALEVFLAGIPRRIGYRGHYRAWLINQIIHKPRHQAHRKPKHHAEHYAHITTELGGPTPKFQPLDALVGSPTSDLGLCPGAEYGPAKRWPAIRYRQVVEEVSQQTGCRWKIFGTAKDRPIAQEIVSGLSRNIVMDYTGKTSLAELIAELASVRLLLTNDTGTMHLAALLGVPIVAIFGSTEPLLTSPLGAQYHLLRHHVECSPCFLRTCPLDFRCMMEISPQQVKEAVLKTLSS